MAESKKPIERVQPAFFKGVEKPTVDLKDGDDLWVKVPAEGLVPDRTAVDPKINISLNRLRVELENQSYGMISASTGCISAPGGPSC